MFDPSKLNLSDDEKTKNNIKKAATPKAPDSLSQILDPLSDPLREDPVVSDNSDDQINQRFIAEQKKRGQAIQEKKHEQEILEKKAYEEEQSNIIGDISDVINNNACLNKLEENSDNTVMSGSKMININITTFDYLIDLLLSKQLDVFTLEPGEDEVKITFKSGKLEKETHYIKYPIYSKILLKAKASTELALEDTQNSQNGEATIDIQDKKYDLISKTIPSPLGEKLFFKISESEKTGATHRKTATSGASLLTFFGIITIIALILGGSFISFIVMNANTLEDVRFFQSLGVNLNDINSLISTVITYIFSALIFVETIFLSVSLFKALLTKKIYKRKKIGYTILSLFLLIITFSTATGWMLIDRKISSLPNWQEMAYGEVQIFDNDKFLSEQFNREGALLSSTSNLIGPVDLKYDLSFWAKQEARKGFDIKRYVWTLGKDQREELIPVLIHTFDNLGTTNIELRIIGVDARGNEIEKSIDISPVNIGSLVQITEESVKSGGKTVRFDASDLKNLGTIDWFFIEKGNTGDLTSVYSGYDFQPSKIIVEDTLIGMRIQKNGREVQRLDKIFLIQKDSGDTIDGEIVFSRDPVDDLKYTFSVKDPQTSFGNGFIEGFNWKIEERIKSIDADIDNPEKSSEYIHNFGAYGEHKIVVELIDSRGKIKALETTINIPKRIKLKERMSISNGDREIDDIRYDANNNEYYIDGLPIPTELVLDASKVRSTNILYTLTNVKWDINDDGTSDTEGKVLDFAVDNEGNFSIVAQYEFSHRKIKDEIVILEERVLIESVKKDAIVDLQIEAESTYVPTIVRFDASSSQVKGKNIEKFIYDYGDGVTEERDAINPGRKYSYPGEYLIKLTIVTSDGEKYSTERKLILKPKPQAAKIITSMKNAPANQGIDFSSDESEGQITGYYWEFGDGNVSVEANPTHEYAEPGDYNVSLKVNFQNNNTLSDTMTITIRED